MDKRKHIAELKNPSACEAAVEDVQARLLAFEKAAVAWILDNTTYVVPEGVDMDQLRADVADYRIVE